MSNNDNKFISAVASYISMYRLPIFLATPTGVYVKQSMPENLAIRHLVNFVKRSSTAPSITIDDSKVSSSLDVEEVRKHLSKVVDIAKQFNINSFFAVSNEASITRNTGSQFIRQCRESLIQWESQHGGDPEEDWGKRG